MAQQKHFEKGKRYRVLRAGCYLWGMRPAGPNVQTGWRRDLEVGDILTCAGVSMTFGDGVPALTWLGADGEYLANDCLFHPDNGAMWTNAPADGCLAPVAD